MPALLERLPHVAVAMNLHEDIIDLAGTRLFPPCKGLDQFRVHLEPPDPFLPVTGLVIRQTDFPVFQVHILPIQPEHFASAGTGEIQGQPVLLP